MAMMMVMMGWGMRFRYQSRTIQVMLTQITTIMMLMMGREGESELL